jgi:hypothetical protein
MAATSILAGPGTSVDSRQAREPGNPVGGVRFLGHAPLGFDAGDNNLYRYVGNNPVTGVDPFGLKVTGTLTTPVGLDSKQKSFDIKDKKFTLDELAKLVGKASVFKVKTDYEAKVSDDDKCEYRITVFLRLVNNADDKQVALAQAGGNLKAGMPPMKGTLAIDAPVKAGNYTVTAQIIAEDAKKPLSKDPIRDAKASDVIATQTAGYSIK